MDAQPRRGFTLLELSMVLVIIALVIGAILAGRDLIKAAAYRAQLKDIDQLNTAINTFHTKYDCLPGDCPNATSFFTAGSQPQIVSNGDGNGHISICGAFDTCSNGLSDPTPGDQNAGWSGWPNAEWIFVYDHLAAAGLVSFPQYDETMAGIGGCCPPPGLVSPLVKFSTPTGASDISPNGGLSPSMVVGYIPGYLYVSSGHKIALGASIGSWGANKLSGINPSDAYALDSKIDDGLPFSGSAVIMGAATDGGIYRIRGSPGNDTGYCVADGTSVYPTTAQTGLDGRPRFGACALYINAAF